MVGAKDPTGIQSRRNLEDQASAGNNTSTAGPEMNASLPSADRAAILKPDAAARLKGKAGGTANYDSALSKSATQIRQKGAPKGGPAKTVLLSGRRPPSTFAPGKQEHRINFDPALGQPKKQVPQTPANRPST